MLSRNSTSALVEGIDADQAQPRIFDVENDINRDRNYNREADLMSQLRYLPPAMP